MEKTIHSRQNNFDINITFYFVGVFIIWNWRCNLFCVNFILQQALDFASPGQFIVHASHVVVRGASWMRAAAVCPGQFNFQHTRLCEERRGARSRRMWWRQLWPCWWRRWWLCWTGRCSHESTQSLWESLPLLEDSDD